MSLRDYQIEANAAILRDLESHDACLVKMFCGTGKTKIMVEGDINKGSNLILYVFPSLQLIQQFDGDYLNKVDPNLKIRVCSDSDNISNTNIDAIVTFLNLKSDKNKIKYVLTTYQSLNTCYEAMDIANAVADVTHFDEAHHCTADTYQKLIFGFEENIDGPLNSRFSKKQIFYTATPRNDNGVIMFEDNDDDDEEGFNDLDFDQFRYKRT
jgi:superfamily II DNA or RNA helicase